MASITDIPSPAAMARFHPDFGQRFIVTVDTEEEFDWSAPFARNGHSIDHVPRLGKFQEFCEGFGVVPIYLVDFPVASSRVAAEVLRRPVMEGRAEIGVQLHPWVSPPHDEEVNERNSFAGNLPYDLERAKFIRLRDEIIRNFEIHPQIYRAGRYGLGAGTAKILREGGIAIDSSVRARFDYATGGGVNYSRHPVTPYWVDKKHSLLELPLTTVFSGPLRRHGQTVHPLLWRAPQLRGLLAKVGLLERIPLTPEGVNAEEAIKGIGIAHEEKLPVLVFSFHSPSLLPGCTPYVRDEEALDRLYDWWRKVFEHLTSLGIRPATVRQIKESIEV